MAIAEQHAVTFARRAGDRRLKPVVAIYSTFLQRAYDQLIHDVAIQKSAGDVRYRSRRHRRRRRPDSPGRSICRSCAASDHGDHDADENECRQMLYTGYHYNATARAPCAVRAAPAPARHEPLSLLPIGKAWCAARKDRHSPTSRHPCCRVTSGASTPLVDALRQTAGRAAGARIGRQP
ncbi:hypothetical protein M8494_21140 [Serratia ureilytica]